MYCVICGAKKVKEPTGFFSAKTGRKEHRHVCGMDACHDGHNYDFNYEGGNFLKKFFGMLTGCVAVCARCGERLGSDG